MSAIASLYNVPTTEEELWTWSFLHAAHHTDIIRTIYQLNSADQLTSYQIDPMPIDTTPIAFQSWLDNHQIMHNQMDAVLGINGFDLDSVNWDNLDERAGWVWLQAQEHYQAATILGIG
jgi:hypothetical protein